MPGLKKSVANKLLTMVMVKLRQERPMFDLEQKQKWYIRYDQAMEGTFAQLWFLTRGCTWDRRGNCTMCNYGRFARVEPEEMTSFVQEGLDSIDVPLSELYVSPSGSLLDELEVPASARRSILQLVDQFPVERFSFETRPETVTQECIDELHKLLPSKRIAMGFGLESADSWILQYCINKPKANDAFATVGSWMHDVEIYANISLGSAFLSPSEAITDTVNSVNWALANGANLAFVFPMHVKKYTLLGWLYEHGLYKPPSLWSLICVLQHIDSSIISRVNISWYRSNYGVDPSISVLASPGTCPNCEESVLAALDQFRAKPSPEVVECFQQLDCECRKTWSASLGVSNLPLNERVIEFYRLLAQDFGLGEWWTKNSLALISELTQTPEGGW